MKLSRARRTASATPSRSGSRTASTSSRDELTLAEIQSAARRLAGNVQHTPCLHSRTFSRLCGADVWLKYENLQRTGSYKIRGALNRILTLPEHARQHGVIAASAGNHAQGVAVAAHLAGVPATIVMPKQAALAKVTATREYGARVVLYGEVFDESHAEALRIAEQEGLFYVHPFDDTAVMAGQGTVALEILKDTQDLDALVVPVGGGGLIAGTAVAAKSLRPGIRVIGVQASGANPTYLAFHGRYQGPLASISTIADGLATRRPGEVTLPIILRYVDDVVTVDDDVIAEAVVLLMERAKMVAEPAGVVALAALLALAVPAVEGKQVCAVITGGNVDLNLIDRILQFGLGATGRHLRLRTQLTDRPGSLARLAALLAEQGANIFEVVHHRVGSSLSVNEVDLELTLEVRDHTHGEAVLQALNDNGYHTDVIQGPRTHHLLGSWRSGS